MYDIHTYAYMHSYKRTDEAAADAVAVDAGEKEKACASD